VGEWSKDSHNGRTDITHISTNFRRHCDVALGICAWCLVCFDDQGCIDGSSMLLVKRPYSAPMVTL
jgi:hypothetical protein